MTGKNLLYGVSVLAIIGLVAVAAIITTRPAKPAPATKTTRSTVSADDKSIESFLGAPPGDILDDKSEPGISMETAKEKAASGILIPSSKLIGKAVKICLTQAEAPKDLVGIGILYDSGIKFFAMPSGDKNLTIEIVFNAQSTANATTFTDGRERAHELVEANGRKYMILKGGTQKFGTITSKVRPSVFFIVDGIEYSLAVHSGTLNENDLLKVAQEMH